jgi:hypothetical protein
MSNIGKHRVRVESWNDGIISVAEVFANDLSSARELLKRHHAHHSENSDSFAIKIYDDSNQLVDSTSGGGAPATPSYA